MGNSTFSTLLSKRVRLAAAVSLTGLTVAAAAFAAPPAPSAAKKPAAKKPAAKPAVAASPATTQPGFTDNTPLTADQKIVHLLNRAAFGPAPGDVEKVKAMGIDAWIDQQLHPETIDDSAVDTRLASFTSLQKSNAELARDYYDGLKRAQQIRKLLLAAQLQKEKAASAGVTVPTAAPAAGAAAAVPPSDVALAATRAAGDREKLIALYEAMTPEQRQEMMQLAREGQQTVQRDGAELIVAKVVRAVESQRQLQEVMADFWTNHFNIDIRKNGCRTYKVSDDRDVVRKYSLGRFRDLLEASAKSPAMLVYLDNASSSGPPPAAPARKPVSKEQLQRLRRQIPRLQARANAGSAQAAQQLTRLQTYLAALKKRAATPVAAAATPAKKGKKIPGLNENYGREIMELHTLGVDGGYSQKDVTEVARCLTGWTIDRATGEFTFNPRRHDDGQKVVLGHVIAPGGGVRDGETVLDILASHPATMKHVSYQLCQRFVSDTPPASLVDKCVATWKRTDGDMGQVVRTILTSSEFNSRLAYQQKIKSPFEYAVSAARAVGATYVVASNPGAVRPAAQGLSRKANDAKPYTGGANGQFLPGQIAVMGEPLFQMQPPTGYPEDSRKWVSSGALISRLNFALSLTGGKLNDVDLTHAAEAVYGQPAATASAAAATAPVPFVNRLTDVLLHGEVSPSTRATLLHEAKQMAAASGAAAQGTTVRNVSYEPGEMASAAPTDPAMARKLVALVLGSPEFQRR